MSEMFYRLATVLPVRALLKYNMITARIVKKKLKFNCLKCLMLKKKKACCFWKKLLANGNELIRDHFFPLKMC